MMSINPTAPRKNLLAATAVSAILATLAALSTASAQTTSGQSTTNQSPKAEMHRKPRRLAAREGDLGTAVGNGQFAEVTLAITKAGAQFGAPA
jgi:hypothetical protein